MSNNDEMRAYVNYLLRHQQECTLENCNVCQTAQSIYEFTRNMIFSMVSYPDVALPAGRRAASAASASGSGRKTSRRAA
ncbi:MAG TPA: hypothetical protein VKT49_06710 [Bryobacteraceae bacterium]|nr:hypothetical protein [Bryobacteraceae bacterium]